MKAKHNYDNIINELYDHCLKQVGRLTPYTFEHYVLMELLKKTSKEDLEKIFDDFDYIYNN